MPKQMNTSEQKESTHTTIQHNKTHREQRREHGLLDCQVLGEPPLGGQVEEGRRDIAREDCPPVALHEVGGVLVVVHDG